MQATATRAVVLALAGRGEQARESAAEAEGLAERLHYPIGRAAALEARGASDAGPGRRARPLLAEAEDAWTELERPLEAARCRLLAGFRLRDADPRARRRAAGRARRTECERLGVAHLADAEHERLTRR